MATELATGYVNLVPSARGFGRGLGRQLTPELSKAGTDAGRVAGDNASRSLGSRLASGVSGLGSRIASTIGTGFKIGMGAVGVVGAAALTKAVTGGVSRLVALENADKRLQQMGLSAQQTEGLMGSLNKTLEGTPYALDAGASAMASFVSSGLDLDKIPGVLDMVADAAAFGQAPLNEVADIFNKVALNGKAQQDVLNELQYRGIPAMALLSDALGMSGEEFSKFVSEGKLDADTFFTAWEQGAAGFGENNIKMAGAAKSAGDTTAGAWANMMTALSRFGAKLAGPIFDRAAGFFTGLTDQIDTAGKAIEKWAQSPAVQEWVGRIRSAFSGLVDRVMSVDWAGIMSGISGAVGSVVSTLRDIDWAAAFADVKGVLRPVSDAIKAIDWSQILDSLASIKDAIADVDWGGIWDTLMDMAGPVVDGLMDVAAAGKDLVKAVWPPLRRAMELLLPVIGAVGFLMHKYFVVQLRVLAGVISWVATTVVPALTLAFTAVGHYLRDVLAPAWQRFGSVAQSVFGAVAGVVSWWWGTIVQPAFAALSFYVTNVLIPGWQRIWAVAQSVFGAVGTIVSFWWNNWMGPILRAVVAYVTNVLIPGWQRIWGVAQVVFGAVASIVSGWWNNVLSPIFRAVVGFVRDTLIPRLQALWDKGKEVFEGVADAVRTMWDNVSGKFDQFMIGVEAVRKWVVEKFNLIVTFFSNLKDRVERAMGRVADAIKGPFETAFRAIRDLWNSTVGGFTFTIPDWVKHTPGGGLVAGKGFTIPEMHTGGVVPGRPGEEVLRMLEGGEIVLSRQHVADLAAAPGVASAPALPPIHLYLDGREMTVRMKPHLAGETTLDRRARV